MAKNDSSINVMIEIHRKQIAIFEEYDISPEDALESLKTVIYGVLANLDTRSYEAKTMFHSMIEEYGEFLKTIEKE